MNYTLKKAALSWMAAYFCKNTNSLNIKPLKVSYGLITKKREDFIISFRHCKDTID